jgi:hypothetical protein
VSFSGLSVSSDGTTITATVRVSTSAPPGSNLPLTVRDGALGNYGAITANTLTIT